MRKMSAVQWNWTADQIGRVMQQLGAELLEEVSGRKSYRTAEGPRADVYSYDGQVAAVEVLLDVFFDPDELDADAYERKLEEFSRKFQEAVAASREVLGEPAFSGPYDSDGFPSDQDALWLASWPVHDGRLMVQQTHEDRELPIRLMLVAAPPPEDE